MTRVFFHPMSPQNLIVCLIQQLTKMLGGKSFPVEWKALVQLYHSCVGGVEDRIGKITAAASASLVSYTCNTYGDMFRSYEAMTQQARIKHKSVVLLAHTHHIRM